MNSPYVQKTIDLDPEAPCLGLVEYGSIAHGIEATDRIIKQAEVRVLLSRSVHPGKYTTLITGSVEEVRESLEAAKQLAHTSLVDFLFLPYVHDKVITALHQAFNENVELEALGILESSSVASLVTAADIAVKSALVHFITIRLADNLGGKSFFTLTGEIGDLEEAMERAVRYIESRNTLVQKVVIPNPHLEMKDILLGKII